MVRQLALAFAFGLVMFAGATSVRADDTLVVTVGCAHCDYSKETGVDSCCAAAKTADGKVVTLKGANVIKNFKEGGSYTVKGTLSADGKSIEVKEMTKKS